MTINNLSLVLHKIYKENEAKLNFEDIHINIFRKLLNLISKLPSKYKYSITFDDGNLSDYYLAFEELQNQNLTGTFFIVPNWIDKKNHLSWDNVKEMAKYGMIIGSHSLSHPKFDMLSSDQCKIELLKSKSIIEDHIGISVNDFAFPFGVYNKMSVQHALDTGYKNIFTTKHGTYKNNTILKPRNSLNSTTTNTDILNILCPSQIRKLSWYLEDMGKNSFKQIVGIERYIKLRNLIF